MGDITIMNDVGDHYDDLKDYDEALKWYEMAANKDDIYGMFSAGYIYTARYFENKSEENLKQAMKWLTKAKNDAGSLWLIAEIYVRQGKVLPALTVSFKAVYFSIIALVTKGSIYAVSGT